MSKQYTYIIYFALLSSVWLPYECAAKEYMLNEYKGDSPSPERGFYKYYSVNSYGYPEYFDLSRNSDFSKVRSEGFSLISSRISLAEFRGRPLTEVFLAKLQNGFDAVTAAGLKVILRFNYNNSNSAGPDAPLSIVTEHIRQLSPVLSRNADVIAVLQAGFIGAWGEWHSSTHGLETNDAMTKVVLELLRSLPQVLSIQIRYPHFKKDVLNTYNEKLNKNEKMLRRVGFHNDCILGADNDLTYPVARVNELTRYVSLESEHVPVGGETCRNYPPRTNCPSAMTNLRVQHFVYLNADYLPEVIEKWKNDGCYQEIKKQLGYRYIIKTIDAPVSRRIGESIRIEVQVENKGWAIPIKPRPLIIKLIAKSGSSIEKEVIPDMREICAGCTVNKSMEFDTSGQDLLGGPIDLLIYSPDSSPRLRSDSRYMLRFANEEFDDTNGHILFRNVIAIGDNSSVSKGTGGESTMALPVAQ